MIRKLTTVSIGVIALAATVMAFRFVPGIFQATEGKISFRSEAQLELIKASSNGLVGLIDTARKNFTFKVAIRSFEGFNSRTQREHFNENYMQTEKYPEASFKGKIIEDIDLSHEGVYSVRAKGIMNIHGVEKERIIRAELTVRNNIITLQSNFSVLLSDHNIPIPKVVHQKLADEIKVEVNTALQPR
ncbi:MAG TPA: YceI family protein [Chitinophagaceae bacterium]